MEAHNSLGRFLGAQGQVEEGILQSSFQLKKGRDEVRNLSKASVNHEPTGFPFAAQAAKIERFTTDRKNEQVILLTNRPPELLNAKNWLKLNPYSV